jgi:hypothetical protein
VTDHGLDSTSLQREHSGIISTTASRRARFEDIERRVAMQAACPKPDGERRAIPKKNRIRVVGFSGAFRMEG